MFQINCAEYSINLRLKEFLSTNSILDAYKSIRLQQHCCHYGQEQDKYTGSVCEAPVVLFLLLASHTKAKRGGVIQMDGALLSFGYRLCSTMLSGGEKISRK